MGWDAMDDESNRDRLKPDSSGFKLAHKLRSMGKIADEFNRAVEREKAFLKNLDHDNDQHILSGGQGITNRRTMFTHRADEYLHAKDKEAFLDFLLSLSLQDINERLAELFQQIHEIINEYHEFLKLIDNAIENIQNDLQNITQRHRELNDAIQAEYFEKDEQGNFKSIAIQDTIAAFERRTGQKIQEDISPEELIQYLNVQRDFEADHVVPFLEEYQERLYEKRGIIQYEKDSLEDELDAIDHAIQAVDDNPNLTEEQRHQKKAEILEQASNIALDAKIQAEDMKADVNDLLANIRRNNNDVQHRSYDRLSNQENDLLKNLDKIKAETLPKIKPILP